MSSFSDRQGLTTPKIVQEGDIDSGLANGLWQALNEHCIRKFTNNWDFAHDHNSKRIAFVIYVELFKYTSDQLSASVDQYIGLIRNAFYQMTWNTKLDFVEFCLKNCFIEENKRHHYKVRVNYFLERECSAYRFVGDDMAPIVTSEAINAIEQAQSVAEKYIAARLHINRAVSLYSDRISPDYRNSVKESISAVESICRIVSGKTGATLGDGLKAVEKKINIHPAVISAWGKLYGYTSDEGGIRHAMLEESKVSASEALYMIVSCSAFVNFLVAEAPI